MLRLKEILTDFKIKGNVKEMMNCLKCQIRAS